MSRSVEVHLLPVLVEPEYFAGRTCVVIDVLRATTTIVCALAAGAKEVIVALEPDDARRTLAAMPAGTCLLAGERRGVKIDGFDLGNSPCEFTARAVGGKSIAFTTTNGTRALLHCRAARRVLVGAAVNLSAVCVAASKDDEVSLLCAGTNGRVTLEDVIVAGAMVERLKALGAAVTGDEARLARSLWEREVVMREALSLADALAVAMRDGLGGRNLIELGYESDIVAAAQIDSCPIVPRFDPKTSRIVV